MFEPTVTKRLILREFEKADYEKHIGFLRNQKVCQYMMFNPLNDQEIREYIKKIIGFQQSEPRKFVKFMVVLKENQEIIGECGIIMPNYNHKEGEIVYRYNEEFWGYGYATEAAKAIVQFGFNTLGLHRIDAYSDIRNEASEKVLEKIGMIKEGCIREHRLIKDAWRSSYIYSILVHEFKHNMV